VTYYTRTLANCELANYYYHCTVILQVFLSSASPVAQFNTSTTQPVERQSHKACFCLGNQ